MPNPLSRRLRRRWLPQSLAVLLVVTQIQAAEPAAAFPQAPAAAPQTTTPPAPQAQPPAAPVQAIAPLPTEQSLKVTALAGNGEMNDLERKLMAPLVVQVLDRNDQPIEGADVVFRFPVSGPSAAFPGGKNAITVRTNGRGQAAALNWQANGELGTFQVKVNASYGNQIGEATVSMTNVTRIVDEGKSTASHESLWSHRWFKIAVIGGAALAVGLGVYFGTRGGSSSGRTVTISPGPPNVGAPQ